MRAFEVVSKRLIGEAAWVAAGQIVSAVAIIASIRIMTELLSPSEFGQLALLLGVSMLAMGLTATPIHQALMRYYADWSRAGRTAALRRVGGRLVARFVLLGSVIIVVGWLVVSARLDGAWFTGLLIAALLIVDTTRLFELSLLNAARRQRGAAFIYAGDAWARPITAIAAVSAFGSSANAVLAGYIAGSALVVVVMHLAMRLEGAGVDKPDPTDTPAAEMPAVTGTDAHLAAAMRRYALPLVPLAIFGWISGVGDRYLIGGMLSLETAGLYVAAYAIASRPFLMLAGIIELTIRPILYNAIAAGDPTQTARVKRTWITITGVGAVFGILGFLFLSHQVGGLLLASEYRAAIDLMPWIAVGYALYTLSNVFSRFCYAFDDTKAVLLLTVAGAVIGIAVLLPAIHFVGLWGAAAAVPVRFGIELALSTIMARRAERTFIARAASNALARGYP